MELLTYDFMRKALLAGALVGVAAPSVGVFLVQRRLSLLGDGIGHVVFMGVAIGLALGVAPTATALVAAIAGAVVIEMLRQRGRVAGDVALALVFYLGIAGGIFFLGLGDSSSLRLQSYLFGSVLTVSGADLLVVGAVAGITVVTTFALRRHLFAISYDEEIARVAGLPVTALNLVMAVMAAMIVAVTAKVVGVLLVSALLVLPVAAVQQVAGSFRATLYGSMTLGVIVTTVGLVAAFYTDQYPAATIVLLAVAMFALAASARSFRRDG